VWRGQANETAAELLLDLPLVETLLCTEYKGKR
jgi:hypothetical protein